jgi:hypothetical protein
MVNKNKIFNMKNMIKKKKILKMMINRKKLIQVIKIKMIKKTLRQKVFMRHQIKIKKEKQKINRKKKFVTKKKKKLRMKKK